MDKRSRYPESPRRNRRRGLSFRIKFLLRMLGLLLVAAIVVGIGTTTNKGWGPDFRGEGPQISAEEAASRNMLDLARSASDLAAGTTAGDAGTSTEAASPTSNAATTATVTVDSESARELQRTAQLLRRHVELLTPGLTALVDQERDSGTDSPASSTASDAESSSASTENPAGETPQSGSEAVAQVSVELGTSANSLLDAAITAKPRDVAALIGAGVEQRLEAQRLAALVPDDARRSDMPPVDATNTGQSWPKALEHRLPSGACTVEGSTAPDSTAASDSASGSTGTESATSEEQRAASSIRDASDAAFRQAYGYQMAAIKHPGAATNDGWKLSATTTDLGRHLEDLLPDDCSPTRAVAYALPRGFDAHPIGSVATSEEQLAALLRDAAASAPQGLRAVLVAEAWLAADRASSLAGTIPDLTQTSE
ncbi:hypothetical protein [Arthrobacter sp.]